MQIISERLEAAPNVTGIINEENGLYQGIVETPKKRLEQSGFKDLMNAILWVQKAGQKLRTKTNLCKNQ